MMKSETGYRLQDRRAVRRETPMDEKSLMVALGGARTLRKARMMKDAPSLKPDEAIEIQVGREILRTRQGKGVWKEARLV